MRTLCPALILVTVFLSGCVLVADPQTVNVNLAPGQEGQWSFARGEWTLGEGVLEQANPDRGSAALLKSPAFGDFTLKFEFNVAPVGGGVRAAAVLFRATGTLSYYWLHFDTKNNSAILVRSTPGDTWMEIKRAGVDLPDDAWVPVTLTCTGPQISISVADKVVLTAEDATLASGCIGFGTSQAKAGFRNITIEGEVVDMPAPLKNEEPPYKVISRGGAAGPYQAFPDACRLANGDLLAVFYDGYGHVSLPNDDLPKGGRIGMVRSSDEGRTWTAPEILFDSPADDRDPHIAQMSDGTLLCSFFTYHRAGAEAPFATCIVRSRDGGKTWDEVEQELAPDWAVSAPVREMDGVYLLGIYAEGGGKAWGGVIRSEDRGETWGEPIPIGKEANQYLDAETDVIQLKDGQVYAALRSSSVNMYCSTSADLGKTWAPATDMGFKGHAPHLYRLSTGEIIMTHRVPATSLHISRDECKTWSGPYLVDTVGGAYPATVELKDGTIMVIYYEEGGGSGVRVQRFRVKEDGIESLPWD